MAEHRYGQHDGESDDTTELRIADAIRAGDHAELATLFRLYWDPLCRYAYHFVGDIDEAQERVAETFAKLWELGTDWQIPSTVRAYLFTAVRHRIYNARRDRLRRTEIAAERTELGTQPGMSQSIPLPDLSIESKDLSIAIRRRLDQLPARTREILILRLQRKLSYDEIAEVLGVSRAAAYQLFSRARRELQAQLPELLGEP